MKHNYDQIVSVSKHAKKLDAVWGYVQAHTKLFGLIKVKATYKPWNCLFGKPTTECPKGCYLEDGKVYQYPFFMVYFTDDSSRRLNFVCLSSMLEAYNKLCDDANLKPIKEGEE